MVAGLMALMTAALTDGARVERRVEQQGVADHAEHRLKQVPLPLRPRGAPVGALEPPGDDEQERQRADPAVRRQLDGSELVDEAGAEDEVRRPEQLREDGRREPAEGVHDSRLEPCGAER